MLVAKLPFLPGNMLPQGPVNNTLRATAMKPTFIFGDPDSERAKLLQQGFASHPQITACLLKPHELRALPNLDAFYLSIMAAERWGSFTPPPAIHEARVLKTTPKDQADGWPPFVIAGVALREGEDLFDTKRGLALIVRAVIEAVTKFNAHEHEAIQNIGFESYFTGIEKLAPLDAAQIICAVYDEVK